MALLLEQNLPLALVAAASPMLFAATVLTLAGRSYPRIRTLAFLTGVGSPFIALGLIITVIVGPTFSLPRFRFTLSPTAEIGLGLLLLLLALGSFLVPNKANQPSATTVESEPEPEMRWFRFFGLGLTSMALNPTAIALFVLVSAHIGQAEVGMVGKIAALILAILVTLAPIEVPLILDLVAPAYTQRILNPIGQAARVHSRLIGAIVLTLLGSYLVVLGLKAL
jgi:hypothetical protein